MPRGGDVMPEFGNVVAQLAQKFPARRSEFRVSKYHRPDTIRISAHFEADRQRSVCTPKQNRHIVPDPVQFKGRIRQRSVCPVAPGAM